MDVEKNKNLVFTKAKYTKFSGFAEFVKLLARNRPFLYG